jgi:Protein kinase domain
MSRDATTVFQRDDTPLTPAPRGAHERFAPGAIIAGRYRIIALLGRGGMGEVYRADDIRLDQQVALKFLPARLESDPESLDRFLAEVRLGRQVSHPNVCRLYDVGDHEGHHFLTMEYVDGEDLASLLQRIGKLPDTKAIDIARDIAAGLAAAHALGIIHRDLKPSNVMLDSRGRARITDFGLAALSSDGASNGKLMGSPAYMAPEQFLGAPATPRSDVYAFGLILYECLTGRRVYDGQSADDIIRRRIRDTSSGSISGVPDIDPAIDRVLRRCLDPDPALRPNDARAVLASMPGGDPLAAALAAGETPSPELVAAAQGHEQLSVRAAWTCLAVLLVAAIASAVLGDRTKLHRRMQGIRAPEGMAERAAEIAASFGAPAPRDRSWWMVWDNTQLRWISATHDGGDWDRTLNQSPSPLRFTYRQSPRPMISHGWESRIEHALPALDVPGMARVTFDHGGRLLELALVPDAKRKNASANDWPQLFALAQLPMARFTPSASSTLSPVVADERRAWSGTAPDSNVPLRVEAASFEGRPVWFAVIGPWEAEASNRALDGLGTAFQAGLEFLAPLLCAVLAFVNLRRGRGDRRVALRLAMIAFFAVLLARLFRAHHAASAEEINLLVRILGHALFIAAAVALGYLGLEPYVRRYQPDALISWVRLAHGRLRDALVGRDVLLGVLGGMVSVFAWHLVLLAHPLFGFRTAMPQPFPATMLGGASHSAFYLLWTFTYSMLDGVNVAVLLVVCRALVKKTWLATILLHALVTLMFLRLVNDAPAMRLLFAAIVGALVLIVLRYAGVLGVTVLSLSGHLYALFPDTLDVDAYYFVRGAVALLAPLVLAGIAFVIALGDRPAFGEAQTGV